MVIPLYLHFLFNLHFLFLPSLPALTSPTLPSCFLWAGSDPILIPSHQNSTIEFLISNFLAYMYSLYTFNLTFLCFIKILQMCFRGYLPITSLVHWALTSSPGLQMVPPCLPNTHLLATTLIFLYFPFLILFSTETLKLRAFIKFSQILRWY